MKKSIINTGTAKTTIKERNAARRAARRIATAERRTAEALAEADALADERPAKPKRPIIIRLASQIVVHTTGTAPSQSIKELDQFPYHYLVTRGGRVIRLRKVGETENRIEVALLGGADKHGKRRDDRTEEQNDALFNLLITLFNRRPEATVVGADEVYVYPYANPGFKVQDWLVDYLPTIIKAVA